MDLFLAKLRFLIFLPALALAGCVAEQPSAPPTHTIAGDRRLPQEDFKAYVSPATWREYGDLEYERYVAIRAAIQPDGTVKVGKVTEAYPDDSWNDVARKFAHEVTLNAVNGGAFLNTPGEIYVIFFKPVRDERPAVIFGRQVGPAEVVRAARAMYFRAFSY